MIRTSSIPLLIVLLASGCDAAGLGLGVGTRCAAEKQNIRRQHGPPDDVTEGVRSEYWRYFSANLAYEFSWDQEGGNCVVSARSVLPVLDPPGS